MRIPCAGMVAVLSAGACVAGPVTPPGGPVSGTYKTLSEVEPRTAVNSTNTPGDADSSFRIASSGSYYLTGNLDGVSGRSVIEIAASNVTLDLMGFRVLGNSLAPDGIVVSGTQSNITIRNGSVRSCNDDGIDALSASQVRIADVTVIACTDDGIVTGAGALVKDCIVENTLGDGINTGADSSVVGCVARDCDGIGIDVDNNGLISRSLAVACGIGMDADTGCVVNECVANGSVTGDGIAAASRCVIAGSSASSNAGDGISFGTSSLATECAVSLNGDAGLRGTDRCLILNNASSSNVNEGLVASDRNLIRGNALADNSTASAAGAFVTLNGSRNHFDENSLFRTTVDFNTNFNASGTKNVLTRNFFFGWPLADASLADDYPAQFEVASSHRWTSTEAWGNFFEVD